MTGAGELSGEAGDRTWSLDWLAGADGGLFRGCPGSTWELAGPYPFGATCIRRTTERVVMGTDGGLWEPRPDTLWRKLHDELLTVVQDVAFSPGEPGLVAASIYGVHVAALDELGVCRWRNCSEGLAVNARACAAILVDDGEPLHWLAGTEAGVITTVDGGVTWETTTIADTPVRALLRWADRYWAGTDERGIWMSDDGVAWRRAADIEESVFCLTGAADGRLLAGTGHGVYSGDGNSDWQPSGPSIWTTAVGADADDPGLWLSGGSLGGMWWTADAGRSWHQVAGMDGGTAAICAPVGREG